MSKFEELFAAYPFAMTDSEVSDAAQNIISNHYNENNNLEVWKQCLNLIDLTTLNGDDTTGKVCDMANKVTHFNENYPALANVAAMCVYPALASVARDNLPENFRVACVSGGFPASQTFIEVKVAETALAIQEGASEIDIVLSVGKFLEGRYQETFDEISELKSVCSAHNVTLKVILETGALMTAENIWKASILAMAAGADFIKTSTGKIKVNATPETTYVMCSAIKAWQEKTGEKVAFKAAGGIATTEEAVQHYTIVREILGEKWLNNESFRFGASRLANNLLTSILNTETKYF